jgi:hypothetical protein
MAGITNEKNADSYLVTKQTHDDSWKWTAYLSWLMLSCCHDPQFECVTFLRTKFIHKKSMHCEGFTDWNPVYYSRNHGKWTSMCVTEFVVSLWNVLSWWKIPFWAAIIIGSSKVALLKTFFKNGQNLQLKQSVACYLSYPREATYQLVSRSTNKW